MEQELLSREEKRVECGASALVSAAPKLQRERNSYHRDIEFVEKPPLRLIRSHDIHLEKIQIPLHSHILDD